MKLLEILKGIVRGGKYTKRTATGNAKRPWHYEYANLPKRGNKGGGRAKPEPKAADKVIKMHLKRTGFGPKDRKEAEAHPEKYHAYKHGFGAALKEANHHVARAKAHVQKLQGLPHGEAVSYLNGLGKDTLGHVSEIAGLQKYTKRGVGTYKIPHHQKGKWEWVTALKGTEPAHVKDAREGKPKPAKTAGETHGDHYTSSDALAAHLDKLFWTVDPKTSEKSPSRWLSNALFKVDDSNRDDVAIEGAMELLNKQKQGKLKTVPPEKFNGFVRAVLNYTAQNMARKTAPEIVSDFHETESVTPDNRENPEELAVNKETAARKERHVNSALEDETDRKIHGMLKEGKAHGEIAHELGVSRQTVSSRLRAIKKRVQTTAMKSLFAKLARMAA
jgi:DNA-directed RNA polymerase specialized sigma24 family protein